MNITFFIYLGSIPGSGIAGSLLLFFFLFQFPNEEDSFHKFVAPEEVLPFTEGTEVLCVHVRVLVIFFLGGSVGLSAARLLFMILLVGTVLFSSWSANPCSFCSETNIFELLGPLWVR